MAVSNLGFGMPGGLGTTDDDSTPALGGGAFTNPMFLAGLTILANAAKSRYAGDGGGVLDNVPQMIAYAGQAQQKAALDANFQKAWKAADFGAAPPSFAAPSNAMTAGDPRQALLHLRFRLSRVAETMEPKVPSRTLEIARMVDTRSWARIFPIGRKPLSEKP